MNEKATSWKNPVIAIVVLAIVLLAGYFYATRERTTDILLTNTLTNAEVAAVDGDLLKILGQLRNIRMDESIFANPVWESLQDFGKTLVPEIPGRQNPFAPLSGR